ncbi:MAG: sulfatase-like hydrolase/transferase, partial [Pirellulaceae bacterium]|nr:sulfatase-like hydrolase/transferase [Pirellulaceae bacterium]
VTAQKGWSAFNRVGPAEKDFQDHEVLETFYQQAESFLTSQEKGKPFFLYLALTAPHTPTSPGVNFQGTSTLGVYGDFVMEVDHAVQRVMGALRGKGFDQNTLLLFASDGPEEPGSEHHLYLPPVKRGERTGRPGDCPAGWPECRGPGGR